VKYEGKLLQIDYITPVKNDETAYLKRIIVREVMKNSKLGHTPVGLREDLHQHASSLNSDTNSLLISISQFIDLTKESSQGLYDRSVYKRHKLEWTKEKYAMAVNTVDNIIYYSRSDLHAEKIVTGRANMRVLPNCSPDSHGVVFMARKSLKDLDISGLNLERGNFMGVRATNVTAIKTNFRLANMDRSQFNQSNCSQSKFYRTNGREADFSNSKYVKADFTGASFEKSKFINSNLRGANLQKCTLTGSNLADADFSEADLRRADLSYTNLNNVNFTDAKLDGTIFIGCHMEGVVLSKEQEEACIGLETTNYKKVGEEVKTTTTVIKDISKEKFIEINQSSKFFILPKIEVEENEKNPDENKDKLSEENH
jgi:uncharacterized protein YjbI with pentapeptide repeats